MNHATVVNCKTQKQSKSGKTKGTGSMTKFTFIRNFLEMITDKRFSLRFRVLNILSGDYLRNYLSVVAMNINECVRALNNEETSDKSKLALIKLRANKAKKNMDDVWYI